MTVAVELVGYAIVLAVLTRLLRRPWVSRAPRFAIVLWQVATGTIVTALLLAAVAAAVPAGALSAGLAGWLHACVMALRAGYASPAGSAVVPPIALSVALALTGRLVACLVAELWQARRTRANHRNALTLLAHRHPALDALVLDHPAPVAYCVPGRHRSIVVTTATLAVLDDAELAGVLAHERAHLHGRHHWVLAGTQALARALPLPVFKTAHREVGRLLEMLADDTAARTQPRIVVAAALATLATGGALAPAPVGALAATDTAVLARVRRLIHPAVPLPVWRRALLTAVPAAVALTPVVLAITPAFAAASRHYCPLSS